MNYESSKKNSEEEDDDGYLTVNTKCISMEHEIKTLKFTGF